MKVHESIGSSKSLADTFCKSIDIGIIDTFSRKYQYRYRTSQHLQHNGHSFQAVGGVLHAAHLRGSSSISLWKTMEGQWALKVTVGQMLKYAVLT